MSFVSTIIIHSTFNTVHVHEKDKWFRHISSFETELPQTICNINLLSSALKYWEQNIFRFLSKIIYIRPKFGIIYMKFIIRPKY